MKTQLLQTIAALLLLAVSASAGNAPGPANVNVVNTPTVNVGNTPGVTVANTPSVTVANTPSVTITGTPTVALSSGAITGVTNPRDGQDNAIPLAITEGIQFYEDACAVYFSGNCNMPVPLASPRQTARYSGVR